MNKAHFINDIAKRTDSTPQQAEKFVDAFVDAVTASLQKGEEVTITGFGAFMAKFRSARGGVNPQKPNERIRIPAVTIPKFKAGKVLKDALKQTGQAGAGGGAPSASDTGISAADADTSTA